MCAFPSTTVATTEHVNALTVRLTPRAVEHVETIGFTLLLFSFSLSSTNAHLNVYANVYVHNRYEYVDTVGEINVNFY